MSLSYNKTNVTSAETCKIVSDLSAEKLQTRHSWLDDWIYKNRKVESNSMGNFEWAKNVLVSVLENAAWAQKYRLAKEIKINWIFFAKWMGQRGKKEIDWKF